MKRSALDWTGRSKDDISLMFPHKTWIRETSVLMRPASRRVDAVVRFCLFSCLVFTGCGGSPSTTPGGATSPSTAAPAISSIAPSNVPAGSTAFTLTVNGANFDSTSVIEVGGVKEATTYVNANQLTTMMP